MNIAPELYNTLVSIRGKIQPNDFNKLADYFCSLLLKNSRNNFTDIFIPKLNLEEKQDSSKSVHDVITKIQEKLQKIIIEKEIESIFDDDFYELEDDIFSDIIHSQCMMEKMENYSLVSKCNCKSEYDICKTPFILQLSNCKNYKRFIELNPVFELIFDEDKKIEFNKHNNYFSNQNYEEITYNFTNLNDLTTVFKDTEDIRVIVSTALYEYSMKNLFFIRAQPRETIIDIFTILSYIQDPEYVSFYRKHNINPHVWVTSFSTILLPSVYINAKEAGTENNVEKIMNILIEHNYNLMNQQIY